MKRDVLNKIIKINSLVMVTGLLYIVQNWTIGRLSFFEEAYLYKPILLKEVIFLITSIALSLILFDWSMVGSQKRD